MMFAGFLLLGLGWAPQVWPLGGCGFRATSLISGLVQPGGLWLGWRGSWLVAGRAGFWGALATWVGVGSSSPQVPGHPTSMCDADINY